jgi:hypothetical protein
MCLRHDIMRLVSLALSLCLTALPLAAQSPTYDLVIRSGRIIDGTGSPWYSGDLGIRDGRIVAIGRLEGAKAKRSWSIPGCRPRSSRASPPRSPVRAVPPHP